MQESSSSSHRHPHQYDHNLERMKQLWAVFFLCFGMILFLFTITGLTNGFSDRINNFLVENLGYVSKWSTQFGPDWFLKINKNFSSLGSGPVVLFFLITISGYYLIRKQQKRLNKFLFVVLGGGFLLNLLKMIFAKELPYAPIEIFTSTISTFPSGHAMMATIFYLTLAVFIARWQHKKKTRRYTLIIASVLIFIIAISRILSGAHTFTEVLAGWAAGIAWLSFCWMLERYIKKNRSVV